VFFIDWNGTPEMFSSAEGLFNSPAEQNISPTTMPMPTAPIGESQEFSAFSPTIQLDEIVSTEGLGSLERADSAEADSVSFQQPEELPKALEDFSDVVEYSNAITQVGPVSYRLKITGLDSQKQMDLFVEAITDSKMGWAPEDIIAKVKLGEVQIENLNAPKLIILVQRLKLSGLGLYWEQRVLS
jgi:hypothetical protein